MAKRYGSSVNHIQDKHSDESKNNLDGKNGSAGFRAVNPNYDGYYARRTQEMQDGGMIQEDLRAIANLPQEVMIKAYPASGPYLPEGLEDSIVGVDKQMKYDGEQRKANFYPKKV